MFYFLLVFMYIFNRFVQFARRFIVSSDSNSIHNELSYVNTINDESVNQETQVLLSTDNKTESLLKKKRKKEKSDSCIQSTLINANSNKKVKIYQNFAITKNRFYKEKIEKIEQTEIKLVKTQLSPTTDSSIKLRRSSRIRNRLISSTETLPVKKKSIGKLLVKSVLNKKKCTKSISPEHRLLSTTDCLHRSSSSGSQKRKILQAFIQPLCGNSGPDSFNYFNSENNNMGYRCSYDSQEYSSSIMSDNYHHNYHKYSPSSSSYNRFRRTGILDLKLICFINVFSF